MKRIVQSWLRWSILVWVALSCLSMACIANAAGNESDGFAHIPYGPDFLAGGAKFYSFGTWQSKENFENVERAQSVYSLYSKQLTWQDIKPMRSRSELNLLQVYYPLSVRWKLKDGREFILDKIDLRPYMKEYFKTHQIVLPFQEEGRTFAGFGDFNPALVHEVKDDTVVIKWIITTLLAPPEERRSKNGKMAPAWKFKDEEFIVTAIPGQPTSGIEFDKQWEFANGDKK